MTTIHTQEELEAALKERSRTQQHEQLAVVPQPSIPWDLWFSNLHVSNVWFKECERQYIRSITFDNCTIDRVYFQSSYGHTVSTPFEGPCSLRRSYIKHLDIEPPGFQKLTVDHCSIVASRFPIMSSQDEYLKSMFLDCTFCLTGRSDIAPSLYDCFLADCYTMDPCPPGKVDRVTWLPAPVPIHGSVRTPSIGQVLRMQDKWSARGGTIGYIYGQFFERILNNSSRLGYPVAETFIVPPGEWGHGIHQYGIFRRVKDDGRLDTGVDGADLEKAVFSVLDQQRALYKLWAGAGK